MEFIEAKTILQRATHGTEWFGIDYNMTYIKDVAISVYIVIVEVIVIK